MSETPIARPLIDAAEQAASAGDYAGAERLLREAVGIQERELGPSDPELANTLNNLGVVCEILDKPADAEQFYQRAHEIAAAVLAPDHPFVTTSRKNLDDFHRARGYPSALASVDPVVPAEPPHAVEPRRAVEPLPVEASRAVEAPRPVEAPRAVEPTRAVEPPRTIEPQLTTEPARAAQPPRVATAVQATSPGPLQPARPAIQRRNNPRLLAIAALGIVLAIGVVTASILWGGADRRDEPLLTQPSPSRPESAAPPPAAERAPVPAKQLASAGEKEIATASTPASGTPAPAAPAPGTPAPGKPASGVPAGGSASPNSAQPIVTSARLCRVLSTSSGDWQCTPPARPVEAGLLSFYTRLRSTTNTTVQHRWYRGDRLYQSRDLRIAANFDSGYRTFSRYRMGPESRGQWRVELRTADGILLHEEQFDVR